MRALSAAVLVAVLATSGANAAGTLVCALTDIKGNKINYAFIEAPDGKSVSEIKVSRNEKVITHAERDRPVWGFEIIEDRVYLNYRRDPRYFLAMFTDMKPKGRVKTSEAALYLESEPLASGECGFW